ncbi:MAG: nitrile hydratase subunit alpha [Pseudomonadota bacterium]
MSPPREPVPNFNPPGWDPKAPRPRFAMGKRVRIAAEPPGGSVCVDLSGRSGVIERVLGHVPREELSPALEADAAGSVPLYRVRFALSDLFAATTNSAAEDTIDIALPEPCLEPFFDYRAFTAETARLEASLNAASAAADDEARSDRGVAAAETAIARALAALREIDADAPPPAAGLVARAWADPAFARTLLADAAAACDLVEIAPPAAPLIALNAADGAPVVLPGAGGALDPALFGEAAAAALSPRLGSAALRAPDAIRTARSAHDALQFTENTALLSHIVVPERPSGAEGWPEARLEARVTVASLLGLGPLRA